MAFSSPCSCVARARSFQTSRNFEYCAGAVAAGAGQVLFGLFQLENRRCRADGDYAMKPDITKAAAEAAEGTVFLADDWFDLLEAGVRTRIGGFIEEPLEAERDAALGCKRYERPWLAEPAVAMFA